MNFTADMLATDGFEETNITLFTGTVGDIVGNEIDREIEHTVNYYYEMAGEDVPEGWDNELTWDFDKAYKDFASSLPDILVSVFPDLFGRDTDDEAPVTIGEFVNCHAHDIAGWGREIITYGLRIDGAGLEALAREHGVTEIHDGHGISGFVRTADDSFWSQTQVIEAVMEAMDPNGDRLFYTLLEWAGADGWVDNYIDYGSFGEKLTEL